MEHKLTKLKHLQQITLTDEERAYLRGRLAQMITTPAPKPQHLFARGMQHGLSIALSSFLFIIFVGGSMAAVAAKALPGDDLYGFKLAVNEGIKAKLLNTPEEKAAFAQTRVANRVTEIKTLAQTKTLTKEKQAIAKKALDSNIADLSTQLSTIAEDSPSAALSVTASLEEDLKANKEAIKDTLDETNDETAAATIEAIDSTLKKVSEQEVKILTKEIDNISEAVEDTSTDAPEIDGKTQTTTDTKTNTTDTSTNTDTDSSVTPLSP